MENNSTIIPSELIKGERLNSSIYLDKWMSNYQMTRIMLEIKGQIHVLKSAKRNMKTILRLYVEYDYSVNDNRQ